MHLEPPGCNHGKGVSLLLRHMRPSRLKHVFDGELGYVSCQMMASPDRGFSFTRALLGLATPELHLCGDPAAVPLLEHFCREMGDTLEVGTALTESLWYAFGMQLLWRTKDFLESVIQVLSEHNGSCCREALVTCWTCAVRQCLAGELFGVQALYES